MGTGRRRRRWTDAEKRRIVAESFVPGRSVALVARRHDMKPNLLFIWRRDPRFNGAGEREPEFLPVAVSAEEAVSGDVSVGDDAEGRLVEIAFGDYSMRCSEAIGESALRRIVETLRSPR